MPCWRAYLRVMSASPAFSAMEKPATLLVPVPAKVHGRAPGPLRVIRGPGVQRLASAGTPLNDAVCTGWGWDGAGCAGMDLASCGCGGAKAGWDGWAKACCDGANRAAKGPV